MEKRDIASILLYPLKRECSSLTAHGMLSMFDNFVVNNILIDRVKIKKIHADQMKEQKLIFWLIDITEEEL